MASTFKTTSINELKLKLPELNHLAEISVKCHLINNLLNNDLILRKEILYEQGLIFYINSKKKPGKKYQFQ